MDSFSFLRFILALNLVLGGHFCFGQAQIRLIHQLDAPLTECSGLIEIGGHFIMHNDSGDSPTLYVIDTLNGSVARQVSINNAEHIDWEDICHDEDYIYISDTGNNFGIRTDLKIYKISINDFLFADQVEAEIIHIAYADQTDFSGENAQHNFDAEALISIDNSLYLFSKNRGDFRTNIYPIPKESGTYIIEKTQSLASQGLITGATYIAEYNMVILTGLTSTNAFIIKLSELNGNDFDGANFQRYGLEMNNSHQIESIAWKGGNRFISATEGNGDGGPALYCIQLDLPSPVIENADSSPIPIFPNPFTDQLYIDYSFETEVFFYNSFGQLELISKEKTIDTSMLSNGLYWTRIEDRHKRILKSGILIKM